MEVNECLWCDLIQLRTSHHGKNEANHINAADTYLSIYLSF